MPKADPTGSFDMSHFGHLVAVDIKTSDKPGLIRCTFDTGCIMYFPETMFLNLKFHLQEADR